MVKIWHSMNFRDSSCYRKDGQIWNGVKAAEAFLNGYYQVVGEIETDDLEVAFEKSQNLHGPWKAHRNSRSTSVGDLMEKGGKFWIVASFGFDRVELLDRPAS